MNIIKKIEQYNNNNIYFCEPVINNIMNNGRFIRILYSSHIIIFNGIYLSIMLNDIKYEKIYSKYKCIFNINNNQDLLNDIKKIEEDILCKYNLKNKTPQYKINEELQKGFIKIFCEINNIIPISQSFVLKISGIWETQNSYGLTYKFII
jgi:hypothetical protein